MSKRPCMKGRHVWVDQVGLKGQRYTICAVCDTPGESA